MDRLQWETKIPVIRNRLVMRPLVALIFPFVGMAGYLIYRSEGNLKGTGEGYALILLAVFFVLAALFWIAMYAGKVAPGYIVDQEGIVNYSLPGKAVRNKFLRYFLVFFGYLRGSYVSASTGKIAYGRQVMKIRWTDIRKAGYYPNHRLIIISSGFDEKMAVFCTRENYEDVEKRIRRGIIKADMQLSEDYEKETL